MPCPWRCSHCRWRPRTYLLLGSCMRVGICFDRIWDGVGHQDTTSSHLCNSGLPHHCDKALSPRISVLCSHLWSTKISRSRSRMLAPANTLAHRLGSAAVLSRDGLTHLSLLFGCVIFFRTLIFFLSNLLKVSFFSFTQNWVSLTNYPIKL